ncbi:MAG: hypothetical protein HON09_08695 [Flavobacteriaceae bacterium]|jgi:hypothetical protein|nr:hypothetical protein [Flavobacteriaceae bacterium]
MYPEKEKEIFNKIMNQLNKNAKKSYDKNDSIKSLKEKKIKNRSIGI